MSTDSATEPTLRVMALHALAYCERLFYLEEVEEIRLADAAVYANSKRAVFEFQTDTLSVIGIAGFVRTLTTSNGVKAAGGEHGDVDYGRCRVYRP